MIDPTTGDVCVVGLGKIGLPLAVRIAESGRSVRGVDIDGRLVALVNDGKEPFPGEAELGERLAGVLAAGRLEASVVGAAAVASPAVVIVVVPLVVDAAARPDFGALDAATATIGPALTAGTLVSYETTLPLGTTRQRFAPALAATSGLTVGRDLFVVHSPERVFSGRIFADLARYPKLVGGVDAASSAKGRAFYESVLTFDERPDLARPNGVWDLGTAEAAELAKLAETTYRDVNIAFANELAVVAEGQGIDVYAVIEAANSQPFSHVHRPGVAVGGHCIPVYPYFLLAGAPGARLPRLAREVNESQPARVVAQLGAVLGGVAGHRILVLGVAYRGGVKEHAFSGAFAVVDALRAAGAEPVVHDPLYDDGELRALGFEPWSRGSTVDAAVVHSDHAEYRTLRPADVPGARVVADGRAILDPADWPGVVVWQVGRGVSDR